MRELEGLLHALRASRSGETAISAWSLHAWERRRLSLGVKDREVGNAHAPLNVADSLGARYLIVWSQGAMSRGHLERRQVVEEPAEAVANARLAAYEDPDAAHVRGPATMPDLDLVDEGVSRALDGNDRWLETRLARVRSMVDERGIGTWSGSFSASRARSRLVTSAGLDVESSGTSAGWHVSFEGEWGDGHAARGWESAEEFGARLERLAETVDALKRDAPGLEAGNRPVILHPHVVEQAVLTTLFHNLDGSTVAHGEGAFTREDFASNRLVLREDLSLRLDPLRPDRIGSYRFTMEGVPAARSTFVERGRLLSPVLDVKYAHRLSREPTPLPHGWDTVDLEAEEVLEPADAWSAAEGGVLVLSVLGVHTQDPGSGDFSLSAPQALRLGAEGPTGRTRLTLSGNLFDLLRDDGLRLVRFEGEHTPGILARCRVDPV